jgi:hypothetical protein
MTEDESIKNTILLSFFCHVGIKALTDICLTDSTVTSEEEEIRDAFWNAVKNFNSDSFSASVNHKNAHYDPLTEKLTELE